MTPAFFDSQWAVLCKRWPWDFGQEEAMRFYRERLRVRACDYPDKALGVAVERICGRQYGGRPPVDELVAMMRDIEPPAYEPPQSRTEAERARAAETLRDYRTRILAPAAAKADAERSARIRKALDDFNRAREPGEEG